MWSKILTVLAILAEWLKRRWTKQDEKTKHNQEVIQDAKDKIDNKAAGSDVHTAIDRLRKR